MSSAVADVPTAADAQTSAFAAAEVAAAAVLLASTAAAVHVLLLPLRPFMCCFYCCGRSCVASTVAVVHVLLLPVRSFMCCFYCCGRSCVASTVAVVHMLAWAAAAGLAMRAPSATTGRSANAKCAAVQSLQATLHCTR